MRYRLAAVVLLATCIAATPTSQPAETYPALTAKLREAQERISILERENGELRAAVQRIVAELDEANAKARALAATKPARRARAAASPVTGDDLEKYSIDEMKIGMPIADVIATLGEPAHKARSGQFIVYTFSRENGGSGRMAGPYFRLEVSADDSGQVTFIDGKFISNPQRPAPIFPR